MGGMVFVMLQNRLYIFFSLKEHPVYSALLAVKGYRRFNYPSSLFHYYYYLFLLPFKSEYVKLQKNEYHQNNNEVPFCMNCRKIIHMRLTIEITRVMGL